ncbi:MAG TPA: acyl-CoA dehydrogenase family protein [Acidimicrobiales bacterium]|nr:acyl-CoA dehydrogenase family protein [Acidimicrobiales bacterium]
MDFDLGAEAEAVRKDVREFIAENVSSDIHERMAETGTYYDADFARALGARGWIAAGWPVEEGGSGRNWLEQVALNQELRHADAPMDAIGTTMLIAATLRMFGTPEQKETIMKPAVRGEVVIALGYTEPDSWSDAAAARTRAVRDGDEWVIDGEKMFTTLVQVADYVFMLTRTNPDVKKHRGLTTFLVPTTSAGFSISEVKTLGGERTNITTYEGVRIPDSLRVGEVDQGWSVASAALELEHSGSYAGETLEVLAVAVEQASQPGPDGSRLIDDPSVRARLAQAAVEAEMGDLLGMRAGWMHQVGQRPLVEGSMAKVYSSEAFSRATSEILDIFGPASLQRGRGLGDETLTMIEHAYRHSQVTRIYAGTSEIHRSIIAEAGLGLPRTRSAG